MEGVLKLILLLITGGVLLQQCKKNDEPVPVPVHHPAGNNLDSVKTLFTGTWKFESVTFQQKEIVATTSNCAKSQAANAGFTDDSWQTADEQNVTFNSLTKASYSNICTKVTASMTVSAADDTDGTVLVTLTDPLRSYPTQAFVVNVADITTTQFRAYLVNEYAYTITYTFSRQ